MFPTEGYTSTHGSGSGRDCQGSVIQLHRTGRRCICPLSRPSRSWPGRTGHEVGLSLGATRLPSWLPRQTSGSNESSFLRLQEELGQLFNFSEVVLDLHISFILCLPAVGTNFGVHDWRWGFPVCGGGVCRQTPSGGSSDVLWDGTDVAFRLLGGPARWLRRRGGKRMLNFLEGDVA